MGLNNISPYIFIVLKFTNQEKGLWLCPYCEQIIHIYASNVFNIDVLEHDINIFSATHSGGKEFAVTSSPLRYSCKSTVYFPVTLSHRINAACIEKVWLVHDVWIVLELEPGWSVKAVGLWRQAYLFHFSFSLSVNSSCVSFSTDE